MGAVEGRAGVLKKQVMRGEMREEVEEERWEEQGWKVARVTDATYALEDSELASVGTGDRKFRI